MSLRIYLAIGPSQIWPVTKLAAIFQYGRHHSLGKRFCLGKMCYIVVFSVFWPSMGSVLLRIRWVWLPHSWAFWEIKNGCHFTEIDITSFLFVIEGSILHLSLCFEASHSIERILNSAKLLHYRKIQYGRQYGCRSEYYPNSVHSYPRGTILVYIPRYSAAHNGFCQDRA